MEQRAASPEHGRDRSSPSPAWRVALLTVVIVEVLVLATAGYWLVTWNGWEPTAQPTPSAGEPVAESPAAGRPSPTASRPPRVGVVTYEVTGSGRVDINYADPGRPDNVILENQRLPWRVTLPRQPVDFGSITASRETYDEPPHTAHPPRRRAVVRRDQDVRLPGRRLRSARPPAVTLGAAAGVPGFLSWH